MASPYLALMRSGGLGRYDTPMVGGNVGEDVGPVRFDETTGGWTGVNFPTPRDRGGFVGRRPRFPFKRPAITNPEMPMERPILGRPIGRPLPPFGGGMTRMPPQGGFIKGLPKIGVGGGMTGGNMYTGQPEVPTNPDDNVNTGVVAPPPRTYQADVPQSMGRLQRRMGSFGRGFTNAGVY